MASVRQARQLPIGIDPDLVFKIRAAGRRLPEDMLTSRGILPLAETPDYTYFVLTSDEGSEFDAAIARYLSGPDREGASATLSSLFGLVNAIEPYGSEDRRGPGLDDLPEEGPVVLDIVLWSSDSQTEANRRMAIVSDILAQRQGEILLADQRPRRTVLRVRLEAEYLDDVLEISVIERVRTPPVPYLDPSDWRHVRDTDLATKERPSAAVGVLDDYPATGHPLLSSHVASVDEISPSTYIWQRPGHHGTLVVGRVLFPYLHAELRDGAPVTAHGLVHVARVLEPDPNRPGATRFPELQLPHETIEKAIRHLHGVHDVRIFNLSFGYDRPFDRIHVDEITETIDDLARELDIVIVVPTGNVAAVGVSATTISGHHVERDYPSYVDGLLWRLSEPGPAALALTVGALSHSDAPEERTPPRIGIRAIAPVDHIAPFSRTGPGIGVSPSRLNKPDLVHDGGNWTLTDVDHVITEDAGVSVISTALEPSGRLFRACAGTSFATPIVARIAGDVLSSYPRASANLIRVLLASSARLPTGAVDLHDDEVRRTARYGYGRPDSVRAVESGARRTTLIYDGSMMVDSVAIHPIPMPHNFGGRYSRTREFRVALGFDPPVRRQRREYLAGTMQLDLYRAIELDELEEIVRKQDSTNPRELLNNRQRVDLKPGPNSFKSGTLQVRTWKPVQALSADDGEVYYLAVTHRTQTWSRERDDYPGQGYALAVTLEDQGRVDLNLYEMLTQQVEQIARVRIRS